MNDTGDADHFCKDVTTQVRHSNKVAYLQLCLPQFLSAFRSSLLFLHRLYGLSQTFFFESFLRPTIENPLTRFYRYFGIFIKPHVLGPRVRRGRDMLFARLQQTLSSCRSYAARGIRRSFILPLFF